MSIRNHVLCTLPLLERGALKDLPEAVNLIHIWQKRILLNAFGREEEGRQARGTAYINFCQNCI
jgi:hypothetical protein